MKNSHSKVLSTLSTQYFLLWFPIYLFHSEHLYILSSILFLTYFIYFLHSSYLFVSAKLSAPQGREFRLLSLLRACLTWRRCSIFNEWMSQWIKVKNVGFIIKLSKLNASSITWGRCLKHFKPLKWKLLQKGDENSNINTATTTTTKFPGVMNSKGMMHVGMMHSPWREFPK